MCSYLTKWLIGFDAFGGVPVLRLLKQAKDRKYSHPVQNGANVYFSAAQGSLMEQNERYHLDKTSLFKDDDP